LTIPVILINNDFFFCICGKKRFSIFDAAKAM
jgi:hypothetical protein